MFQFVIGAVLSIIVLATCLFLRWAWLKPKRIEKLLRKQGQKGNPYKFLFGDSKETVRMYEEAYSKPIGINDDVVPRLMPNISHYVRKYGNFCFTWAGPRPRIFIMDPNIARYVLSKHLVFLKPFPTSNYTVKKLMSGLVGMEGEEWSKTRTRDNAAFKHEKLKPMVPMIEQCCEETINDLKIAVSKGGGTGLVDVSLHMKKLISSLFARAMFNCPFTDRIEETFKQVEELSRLAQVHAQIFSIPGEKYLPTKKNRQLNALEKDIKDSLTSIIDERLRNPNAGKDIDGNKDLLDMFMVDLSEGKFSNNKERHRIIDEIIGQIQVYFFGSSETTTNVLAWSLILLSYNQDCQNRAREEVLQVLGRKDKITHEVLAKLKYINMIVQETLRLYNPIMEITRLVAEDVTIDKYQIPKDSLLTFPLLMYNRSPEYWGEDAQEFKPERFAEGVGNAFKGENPFMPFGWGPRFCIGMNFALIEAKIALAALLREFSFEPSPTYTHAPCATFSVHPQFGAPLVLKKL